MTKKLPIPLDFIETSIAIRQNPEGFFVHSFFIAPNLSFDFYKIKTPSSILIEDFSKVNTKQPSTGFLIQNNGG